MAARPYISAPGNIKRALRAIQSAATPERVSQDFVKTILNVPGGSGNQVTSFLKKIGFVNADGSPSDLYKKFRNSSSAGQAAAKALKIGYAPLYVRNEYMHQLADEKLRGLVLEETGQGEDSSVAGLVIASIKAVKKFADWSGNDSSDSSAEASVIVAKPLENETRSRDAQQGSESPGGLGLNLSYTINLNLPASSDIAVFNAIFKSLKDNLLRRTNE